MNRPGVLERAIRKTGFVLFASVAIMLVCMLALSVLYYLVEGDQRRYIDPGAAPRTYLDWLYFTVITTRTIGFGDITVKTTAGKLLTIFNALLPASLFFGASMVLLNNFFTWLEKAYRRLRMKDLKRHHVIVADPELLESVVQEYRLGERPFVCVSTTAFDDLPGPLQDMLREGQYYAGDPTRDEVLKAVNIDLAEDVLIATPDDNVNLYVLVTVKGLARQVKTIVRVNRSETESKFRSVGADVLLPSGAIVGRMLSQAAVMPVAQDLLVRLQTGTTAPTLEEVRIGKGDEGKPVREAVSQAVALFRQDHFSFDLEQVTLREGDVVLRLAGTY